MKMYYKKDAADVLENFHSIKESLYILLAILVNGCKYMTMYVLHCL